MRRNSLAYSGLALLLFIIFPLHATAQIFGSAGITTGNINSVQALQRFQRNADQFYTDKRYDQAFRDYKTLSKLSDKHSQYRLATMYFDGLGVREDIIEAYAWSFVSAESKKPEFVAFHKQIRTLLTDEQLIQARMKAGKYIAEYGLFRAAINARKLIAREKKTCTGSRVGATCSQVASNSINCSGNIGSTPSRRCLIFGSVGLTGIGVLPVELRKVERSLDSFIAEYNPGRVELGDLELIDE